MNIAKYIELPINKRLDYIHNLVESEMDKPFKINSDYFLSILQWEEDALIKWHIIKALGILKDTKAIPYLIKILLETNSFFEHTSLHHITAWSLGQIGSPALMQVHEALYKNQDRIENRIAFADALGQIADSSSLMILKDLFLTSSYGVKETVALAFSKIGDTSIDVIIDLYEHSKNNIDHILLLDSLFKIKGSNFYGLLEKVLENGIKDEIIFILESKIDFNNSHLFNQLLRLSNHSDLEIANKASNIVNSLKLN